jgi:hypothetical protein
MVNETAPLVQIAKDVDTCKWFLMVILVFVVSIYLDSFGGK